MPADALSADILARLENMSLARAAKAKYIELLLTQPVEEHADLMTSWEAKQLAVIERERAAGREVRMPSAKKHLRALIKQGWRAFYTEIFGQDFVDSLDSLETDDKHHSEAIEWHWTSRIALLEGERPPNDEYAYFPIWSRGHMKTMLAEAMVAVDAVLSYAYEQPGFCLYIGREKDKVTLNIANIERNFALPKMKEYAPGLSQVKRNRETNQLGRWSASIIQTATDYTVKAATAESAQAGAKIGETRVTFFCLDDVDDRDESPAQSDTKYNKIVSELLPMRQANTLTFFAQNLINRFSTMYRIQKGQSKALANRKMTQPVPAVRDLVTEQRTMADGRIRDIFLSGKSTWRVWDAQRIQDEIDTMTLPVFLTECQHEVEQSKVGQMIHNYDDSVHVISESEFASIFGTRKMPESWPKEWCNDWARTKTAYHANIALWRTVSAQDSPLPGFTFYFYPMSFRANAQVEDVAERILSCLDPYVDTVKHTEGTRITPLALHAPHERMSWSDLRRDELLRANALMHTREALERIEFERAALQEVIPQYSEPLLFRNNVVGGVNSHEREDIRLIYNQVYALKCQGVNPGKYGGVEQINRDFAVDYKEPHPFRPEQKGFSRTFIVVPDDTSQESTLVTTTINGVERTVEVFPPEAYPEQLQPDDLHDDKLIRYQLRNWRQRAAKLTEAGEVIDEPLKMNDDFGNGMMMMAFVGQLQNTPLTIQQELKMLVEAKVPQVLRDGEIVVFSKSDQQNFEYAKVLAEEQLKKKYGEDIFEYEYQGGSNWYDD